MSCQTKRNNKAWQQRQKRNPISTTTRCPETTICSSERRSQPNRVILVSIESSFDSSSESCQSQICLPRTFRFVIFNLRSKTVRIRSPVPRSRLLCEFCLSCKREFKFCVFDSIRSVFLGLGVDENSTRAFRRFAHFRLALVSSSDICG